MDPLFHIGRESLSQLDDSSTNRPRTNLRVAPPVIQRMVMPGVKINKLFRLVRDDAMEATAGRQEPYVFDGARSLAGGVNP